MSAPGPTTAPAAGENGPRTAATGGPARQAGPPASGDGGGFHVVVCGSLHLDLLVEAPALPQLDETAVGTGWRQLCGGKGLNQAVMAARMGARTAMIGRVGADDFGRRLVAHLDEAEVDRGEVAVDPGAGSGMSVAILDPAGDYGAVIVSGANLATPPGEAAQAWARLGAAAVLVLQNEVPEAVSLAVAEAAGRTGARVLLNAAPARPMAPELLDRVDILVVNRVEAAMLAGMPVTDVGSAVTSLGPLGADRRAVVVTLGSGGLVAAGPGMAMLHLPALPAVVRSTHGAGDGFVGALAARIAAGDPMPTALAFANRAAGLLVALDGPARARLTSADVA